MENKNDEISTKDILDRITRLNILTDILNHYAPEIYYKEFLKYSVGENAKFTNIHECIYDKQKSDDNDISEKTKIRYHMLIPDIRFFNVLAERITDELLKLTEIRDNPNCNKVNKKMINNIYDEVFESVQRFRANMDYIDNHWKEKSKNTDKKEGE